MLIRFDALEGSEREARLNLIERSARFSHNIFDRNCPIIRTLNNQPRWFVNGITKIFKIIDFYRSFFIFFLKEQIVSPTDPDFD